MLNNTRLKVYMNAYSIRISNGEKIEDIDKSYLDLHRLTKEDIKQIHSALQL